MRLRPRRRFGLIWLYALLVLVLVGSGGWYYLRAARRSLKRVANDTIELPLSPPNADPWTTANAFPGITFAEPVLLLPAPNDPQRLFVLERRGTVVGLVADPGSELGYQKSLLLDIAAKVVSTPDGDNGALGLALHPQFGRAGSPNRGYFYVLYTAHEGRTRYNRLSRFTLADGRTQADAASELVLIDQLDENEWHDGGPLVFGPDGYLYLGMGDEGWAEDYYQNGQKIDNDLFSGILRLDVDRVGGSVSHAPPRQPATGKTAHYFIPNDNPFVGVPNALEEFWAIGLRNPYRMSFDRQTGQLWAGDVGQNLREEICLVERGSNHQWSYAEGSVPFKNSYLHGQRPQPYHGIETRPVFEYPHVNGNNCVIGGYVYRGRKFPQLAGKYIYGDNVSGRVWALDYDQPSRRVVSNVELLDLPVSSKSGLSSLAEDADGELYLCVLGSHGGQDGTILRLEKTDVARSPELPKLLSQTGAFTDLATLKPQAGVLPYDVNAPLWSDGAAKQRWIMVPGDGNDPESTHDRIGFSPTGAWTFPVGTVFIKHFELPIDERDPTLHKRLETRFLVCDTSGGVYGFTYKWNDAGTDAELLSGGLKEEIEVQLAGGQTRRQTWQYPSRADCLTCHTSNAHYVLGVKTSQLTKQLVSWNRLGLFHPPLDESLVETYPRLVAVDDTSADLETRVRSYLDANCASCHRPNGIRATFDVRFETPLAEQGLIDGPLQKDLGLLGGKIVKPREVSKSMLVQRLLDATHKMPPLGSSQRDMAAIGAMCQWIDTLPPPLESDPPTNAPVDAAP